MPLPRRETLLRLLWGLGLPGALLLLCCVAYLAPEGTSPASAALALPAPDPPSASSASVASLAAIPEPGRTVERVLARGETLSSLLTGAGLSAESAEWAARATARFVDLKQLKPGTRLAVRFDASSAIVAAELRIDGRGVVRLAAAGKDWTSLWDPFTRTVEIRSLRGELKGSFESSVVHAGGPEDLAYEVGEVLQWDLDFNRDLRAGDSFEVLYEEVYLDGLRHDLGKVVAVRYLNRGKPVEAYRFGGAYYDGQGRPLQKMFLRSPIPYSRVTSGFSSHRFHPILKAIMPHYGVDYGAPIGTPARVTASGVVEFADWDGGGGRTVKVRHPNGFLTCYLHLSRFADGARPGRRVTQGDVIGYVGSSGLATGPHLDYRVQKNGAWIDPLSLKTVPSDPVPTTRIAEFRGECEAMRRSLAGGAAYQPAALAGAVQVAASSASDRQNKPGAPPAGSR